MHRKPYVRPLRTKRKLKSDPLQARILTGQMSPQVLWACAAEKIADAEQAIK